MPQSPLYLAKKIFGEQTDYVLQSTFGEDYLTMPIHHSPYRAKEMLGIDINPFDTYDQGLEKVRIKWLEFWPPKRALLKEKIKK